MKKLIIAVAAVAISTSAMAWGPREQSALTGLVIGGIVGSQMEQHGRQHDPHYNYHRHDPVYAQPQPQICGYNVWCPSAVVQQSCFQQQIINQHGYVVGTRVVCN